MKHLVKTVEQSKMPDITSKIQWVVVNPIEYGSGRRYWYAEKIPFSAKKYALISYGLVEPYLQADTRDELDLKI